MKHMILGTAVLIISIAVIIIGIAIMFWPLEYTCNALVDNYPTGPMTGDASEISGMMGFFLYCLLAAGVFGIILLFIWFYSYAHKFEYEQD